MTNNTPKSYVDMKVEEAVKRIVYEDQIYTTLQLNIRVREELEKLVTDLLLKVEECIPEEKKYDHTKTPIGVSAKRRNFAKIGGWNNCRETILNNLNTLRK